MKTLSIGQAQHQLRELIALAHRGEIVVLTDGDKQVMLQPGAGLDLEADSPELEAELLKAVHGPHAPFAESELRAIADRAIAEHHQQRK